MKTDLTAQVEAILRECAETCILPYFGKLNADQIQTKSSATDIVTIADQEAEVFLTERLLPLIPGSAILGEEGYAADAETIHVVRNAEYIWIVDPLDGTSPFRRGEDTFCTMVSLIYREEIVGAWIYAPRLNKFAAWEKGTPVTLNSAEIYFDTEDKSISELWIACAGSYGRTELKQKIYSNAKGMASCRPMASIGTDFLLLLENQLDAIFYAVGNPWDISCGAAMVSALGGKALKISGASVAGDEVFTTKGAFLAVRCPGQWEEMRDILLNGIDQEKYFA